MRVQATKQGFYDQVLREIGEVFDLLDEEDGSMPIRMKRIYAKDKEGKDLLDEWTEEPWLDANGNAVHRDFAPDTEQMEGKGAFRGERYAPGWMVEVPETVEIGIYDRSMQSKTPEGRAPIQRIIRPSDEPLNAPRATQSRGKIQRQHRAG